MNEQAQQTQYQAFQVIERMAALCATPGISSEVQRVANSVITDLLEKVIRPSLAKLSAQGAGIIVK